MSASCLGLERPFAEQVPGPQHMSSHNLDLSGAFLLVLQERSFEEQVARRRQRRQVSDELPSEGIIRTYAASQGFWQQEHPDQPGDTRAVHMHQGTSLGQAGCISCTHTSAPGFWAGGAPRWGALALGR